MKRIANFPVLFAGLLLLVSALPAAADTVVFDFDDGTFQQWELLNTFGEPFPDESPVSWIPFDGTIDIGDGFTLLPATSGDYRVVPDPWENRDCIGLGQCDTQILRSPTFFLDSSGDLSIDMIGGGAVSDRPFDDGIDILADLPEDLPEFKENGCCQGFALRDVTSGEYIIHAFSTGENDGKMRPTDRPERGVWETVAISQEELAAYADNGQTYQIDIYDSYQGGWGWIGFDTVKIPGKLASEPVLQAGDADQDLDFDQLDLVQVQIAAKYLTGQPATWGEGDWNGAPGGQVGNPPPGNGEFDQGDIIAALQGGFYLTGPYGAVAPDGATADGQTSIGYHAGTGEVWVDAPAGAELTSVNIESAASIFTGDPAQNLGGSFDNDTDSNIFKATFGSSFGSLSFGNVAQAGLSEEFVAGDLTVVGSLEGGGGLGAVDLVYIPEPASVVLAVLGLIGLAAIRRRRVCPEPRNRYPTERRPQGTR